MSRRIHEAVVAADHKVLLPEHGFAPGTRVLIVELTEPTDETVSAEAIAVTDTILKDLRARFPLTRYDDPEEPVAVEDWDMLHESEGTQE